MDLRRSDGGMNPRTEEQRKKEKCTEARSGAGVWSKFACDGIEFEKHVYYHKLTFY